MKGLYSYCDILLLIFPICRKLNETGIAKSMLFKRCTRFASQNQVARIDVEIQASRHPHFRRRPSRLSIHVIGHSLVDLQLNLIKLRRRALAALTTTHLLARFPREQSPQCSDRHVCLYDPFLHDFAIVASIAPRTTEKLLLTTHSKETGGRRFTRQTTLGGKRKRCKSSGIENKQAAGAVQVLCYGHWS